MGFQSGSQKNSLFRLMLSLYDCPHRVGMVRVACGSGLAEVGRVFAESLFKHVDRGSEFG